MVVGPAPTREMVLELSCGRGEGGNSHSIDRQSVTKAEEARDFGVGLDPDLSPLERALRLRVEKDTSDTDCG